MPGSVLNYIKEIVFSVLSYIKEELSNDGYVDEIFDFSPEDFNISDESIKKEIFQEPEEKPEIKVEEELEEEIIPRDIEFNLKPVKNFVDEFVGMIITDFHAYHDDLEQLEDDVSGTILSSVKFDCKRIYMNLSSYTGKPKGTMTLSPTLTGQFTERSSEEEPANSSRFRINFYGGFSIEYLDGPQKGAVGFQDHLQVTNDSI